MQSGKGIRHLSALVKVSGNPFFLFFYPETQKKFCSTVAQMQKQMCPNYPKWEPWEHTGQPPFKSTTATFS